MWTSPAGSVVQVRLLVELRAVVGHHAVTGELAADRTHRLADHADPLGGHAGTVAIVERRHDFLLERLVDLLGVVGVLLRPARERAAVTDAPAVALVVALGPPAVEHGKVNAAALGTDFHAAGAGGLHRGLNRDC